jgi:hypothetical protein
VATKTSLDVLLAPSQSTTVTDKTAPFSWGWVWASCAGFVVVQVVLSELAANYLLKGHRTQHLQYLVEGAITLSGYYLGGFLIGFFSPRVRLWEPTVAAAVAMFTCLSVGWSTPLVFYKFGVGKFILGSFLASSLAFSGAFSAEKLTGQVKD